MGHECGPAQRRAFTLVEVLVVLAVIAVIAGMVYASSGEVRERARQTACISNLRQIGQAIAMYRQDWGGSDTPGWPAQMGLPPRLAVLIGNTRHGSGSYLAGGRAVLVCPDDPVNRGAFRDPTTSYGSNIWYPRPGDTNPDGKPEHLPLFTDIIARRGSDFPLAYCGLHNFPRPDRPAPSTKLLIVLRLDGRVEISHGPAHGPSWEW